MARTAPIPSPACNLFESLAVGTWEHLMYSVALSCSQSETTITDLNLLELIRARLPNVRIYKAHGLDEPQKGFDWEWYIGGAGQWHRYSVQAKKLHLANQKYDRLRHKVGPQFQIDILRNFAQSNNSIPLYCFYNYIPNNAVAQAGWNCSLPFDAAQLGCTLAPLHAVDSQHVSRAPKDFAALHNAKPTYPWRCLVCCPAMLNGAPDNPLLPPDWDITIREELPAHLAEVTHEQAEAGFEGDDEALIELPAQEYESELGGFPKRIMIIDLEQ